MVPEMFQDANIAEITGWTFEEIDNTDAERLRRFLLFKRVKQVAEFGGELDI